MGIPSGTVTFLFTDIEGSTRLWEESPDAMRAALARHDELVRGAIEGHHGYVFATGGVGGARCRGWIGRVGGLVGARGRGEEGDEERECDQPGRPAGRASEGGGGALAPRAVSCRLHGGMPRDRDYEQWDRGAATVLAREA